MNAGGPIAISIGWPLVGAFVLLRRPRDGRDLLRLPDGGWALLLGRAPGPPQQAGLGLVRRVVQLPRRGRRDRGDRLRRRRDVDGAAQPRLGIEVTAVSTFVAFLVIIAPARAAQHLRRQPRQAALERQRLVAPRRRRDHRRGPRLRAGPAPEPLVDVLPTSRTAPAGPRRSTPSSSACSWRSTPTRASTPRRTSPRRPSTPPPRHRRASSAACGSRSSPAGCSSSP